MEVGSRRISCSIRRPDHPPPPPPPPPPLKPRFVKELEGKSALQDSDPVSNLVPQPAPSKQNAPLRRAPPPPLPRAPQISNINCGLPFQPQNRPMNCNLPSLPHVRNTQSLARSISAMSTKTSAPVSVVRPYNFPPLPTAPSFDSEVESSEESRSPEDGSFFKDPAQHKIQSSSPSFLDELQQVFPLLRLEGKALPSHPNCESPGKPKFNEDDQSEPNTKCRTSNDQDCLSFNAKASSIADLSKAASSCTNVKSHPPFKRPAPPPIALQRGASVPVMPHTNPPRKATPFEKPALRQPQLSSFTKTTAASDSNNPLFVGKELVHQTATLRPVFKSSSLRELTISRNEVGFATLPRSPAHRQRPSLPPRPRSLLLPASPPPPPPRRRESLLLPEVTHIQNH